MCGFAAVLGSTPLDADAVESVLAMRGPDGRGLVCDEHRWLLHRRLSIIDLSEDSAQPFIQGDTTTLYNGEIYNYAELGAKMGGLETTGDTEVFARLVAEGSIADARGMYAGAVLKDGALTVTRDRFGIKPLYRAKTDTGVAVASQLRCFPALTGHREIDPRAIASVLRFGSVIGCTMFKGVEEVPPGTTTVIEADGTETVSTLPPVAPSELGPALRRSVERHLVSDVPVAVLLSGGLDSAVIAKLAAESGTKPVAITLSPGGDIDETERAARTAKHYGLEHIVEKVDEDTMLASIDDFFDAMDQPSIDGFNTFLVSAAIRRAGFKVALSGLGADELFGGYSSFRRIEATYRLRHLPAPLLEKAMRRVGVNQNKVGRWVGHRSSRADLASISREVFSRDEVRRMCGIGLDPERAAFSLGDDVIESEVGLYMSPMLLRDADAHSMAQSVELRVPFLDDEVVGAAVARSRRVRTLQGKKILASAVGDDYLGQVRAEPKTGFRLPFSDWLEGPLSNQLNRALGHNSVLRNVIDISAAQTLSGDSAWSRAWSAIVANEWLIRHG